MLASVSKAQPARCSEYHVRDEQCVEFGKANESAVHALTVSRCMKKRCVLDLSAS